MRDITMFHVYVVTTLAASGFGSLSDALQYRGDEHRIVVFDVSGDITLDRESSLFDFAGMKNITVFGNTSPGGIQITGHPLALVNAKNVSFHHMVWSLSANYDKNHVNYWNPIKLLSKDGGSCENILFSHCSFRGGQDENDFGPWNHKDHDPKLISSRNVVVDACLFGAPYWLHRPRHNFNLMLVFADKAVVTRSLFVHANRRSPQIHGDNCLVAGNVIYNYGTMGIGVMPGSSVDVIDNLFIPGPNSNTFSADPVISTPTHRWAAKQTGLFMSGNTRVRYKDVPYENRQMELYENHTDSKILHAEDRFTSRKLPAHDWTWVLDNAGACWNDSFDKRMRWEARRKKGYWYRTEWAIDSKGFPKYPQNTRQLPIPDELGEAQVLQMLREYRPE